MLVDLIFSFLLWTLKSSVFVIIGSILLISRIYWRRQRLFRFLGVNPDKPELTIYLSTLIIPEGEARLDNNPSNHIPFLPPVNWKGEIRSFRGLATTTDEVQASMYLKDKSSIDPLDILPHLLKERFAKYKWFRPLEIYIKASPPEKILPSHITSNSIVSIGSSAYNSISGYYEEHQKGYLRLSVTGDQYLIEVMKGQSLGEKFSPIDLDRPDKLGILEKIIDDETNSVIFLSIGGGVNGSIGGIEYLADNWEQLFRRYREKPFGIVFEAIEYSQFSRSPLTINVRRSFPPKTPN